MKKKFLLVLCCVFAGTLISCNWQIPQKVSVKTSASYSFSLGEMSYPNDSESEDGINLYSTLSETISSASTNLGDLVVLDYNPTPDAENNVQQLAVKIPIQQFDLDVSQYLDQVDLDSSLETMDMDYSIDIPELGAFSETQNIDISDINDSINNLLVITTIGGLNVRCAILMDEGNNFDSITYDTGTFNVQIYEGTKAVTSVDTTIYIDGEKVVIKNGKGSLSIDGKTITKDGMLMDTTSVKSKYTIVGSISSESQIKKVEGLTLSSPISFNSDAVSIPVGNSSALKKCVVKTGSAEVSLNMPESWLNVTNNSVTTITEGLTKNDAAIQFTAAQPTVDLYGATYVNGDVSVVPSISLTFADSTIIFADQPYVIFDMSITDLETVQIGFSTDQSLKQSLSSDLPAEALSILKMIEWNAGGIEVKATNTLPEGNPISIKISSGFMGIDEVTQVINSGVTEEQTLNWSCPQDYQTYIGSDTDASPKQYDKIDFSAEIIIPNYDQEAGLLTLNNVALGGSYSIQLSLTPTVDWKAVVISNDAASITGTKDLDLNIGEQIKQLETTDNQFTDKIRFDSLPIYLFCDFGDMTKIFDNPSISGNIYMCPGSVETVESVVDGETVEETKVTADMTKATYLLGSAENQNAKMESIALPDFEQNEDGTYKTVTSKITSSVSADLAEIMDSIMSDSEGLSVGYTVKFSTGNSTDEIRLEKSKIMEAGSAKIDMSAILVVPLKLRITNDGIKIDNILSLFGIGTTEDGSTYDLLNRTSKDDLTASEDYVNAIKSASIIVKHAQLPLILDNPIVFGVDLDGPDSDAVEIQTIELKSAEEDTDEIKVGISSPKTLLETYPLQPAVSLSIPEGCIGIPRNIKISGLISLNIKANGNQAITIWEKNADTESEGEE